MRKVIRFISDWEDMDVEIPHARGVHELGQARSDKRDDTRECEGKVECGVNEICMETQDAGDIRA